MYYAFYVGSHLHLRKDGEEDLIRFLGHPRQIGILEQYYRKQKLEICSVNYFDMKKMENPEAVLDRMQEVPAQPEIGGWRELDEPEAYALMLGTCPPPAGGLPLVHGTSKEAVENMAKHPLVRAGGLFPFGGAMTLSMLSLMIYIYDIRRFADPEHPTRSSQMKSYFRLTSPNALFKFFNEGKASYETVRSALAFCGWFQCPFNDYDDEAIRHRPEAFLFREASELLDHNRKHYNEEEAKGLAMWKTTVRFMNFTKMLWNTGVSKKPFDPKKFFKREDEVEAFSNFINKFDYGFDNHLPSL